MTLSEMPAYTKEQQEQLFSYLDAVIIDYDNLGELKKMKINKKGIKKPRNK
jgi:hypothetical protein